MKTHKSNSTNVLDPTEDEIRECAFHLYEKSGCVPGRDLDNWLEATACLHLPKADPVAASANPVPAPEFGVPSPGHVKASAGHGRPIKEMSGQVVAPRHVGSGRL